MKVYHPPAALLALTLVGHPVAAQMTEGLWVGDLSRAGSPPLAVRFDVALVDGRLAMMPLVPGAPIVPAEHLRATGNDLSFSWTPSQATYECQLSARRPRHYEGACVAPSGTTTTIRILPPGTAPIGLAHHLLASTDHKWEHRSTDHINLYLVPGSYPYEHADSLAHDAEAAWTNALRILQERDYRPRINLFYVGSREATGPLLGQPAWGRTDPFGDTILLAWNHERTLFQRHEIMHVVAWGTWGIAALPDSWISEGLAVFAQGQCRGYDLHQLVRSLDQSGTLVPLATLINRFWEQQDVLAYVQAGSLVRYVYEVYGIDTLRALWTTGVGQVRELMGVTLAQLDSDWRRHAARTTASGQPVDWKPADGC